RAATPNGVHQGNERAVPGGGGAVQPAALLARSRIPKAQIAPVNAGARPVQDVCLLAALLVGAGAGKSAAIPFRGSVVESSPRGALRPGPGDPDFLVCP